VTNTNKTFPAIAEIYNLSGPDLVALHNRLIQELPEDGRPNAVKRFPSLKSGQGRVRKLLKALTKDQPAAPQAPKAKEKAERAAQPRKHKGTNLLPGEDVTPCREGTKQSIMVDLLSRKEGTTMAELLQALSGGKRPWVEATVRSGFGWDMKLHGYGVRSVVKDGEPERFYLVLPHGKRVAPHTPRKSGALVE